MKPVSSGYADVNRLNVYHEIYGQGEPLVLIHGGLTTIGEMQGWAQPLAHLVRKWLLRLDSCCRERRAERIARSLTTQQTAASQSEALSGRHSRMLTVSRS
jgi:pimeloyl-ACP methyl ester carboxylesterase